MVPKCPIFYVHIQEPCESVGLKHPKSGTFGNGSKPFKTLKSSTSHPKNGHGMVYVGMLINQLCLFSVVVTHFLFQTCQNPSVEKWRSAPPAPCPFRASVTEDATLTEAAASHSCAGAPVNLRHGGVTLDGLQPMAHGRSPMIYHRYP